MPEPKTRATFEMGFASILWGFGFIATIWALPAIGPVWMTSLRFLFAVLMLDVLFRAQGKAFEYRLKEWLSLMWPGFFLFGLLTLQTWGLKYTSATRSGFITVLYVLFVPFLERIFLKLKIRKILWLWITLGLLGTLLICGALTSVGFSGDFLKSFNLGDFLTLLCALCSAAHFIVVNKKMNVVDSPVKFHIYQSVWIVVFATVLAIGVEGFGFIDRLREGAWTPIVWIGMAHLAFLSSGLAFLIQVRAQRFLTPSTVGLLLLLESVWAMTFSVLFLGEHLTALQIAGAGLILVASLAESLTQAQGQS